MKTKISLLCIIASSILFTGCSLIETIFDVTYSVTYMSNKADYGDVPIDDKEYEDSDYVTVKGNVHGLTREGYNFEGWSSTPNGNVEFVEGDTVRIDGSDLTFFAVWKKVGSKLVYHANGATSGECPADQIASDDTAIVAGNSGNLSKDNYDFVGWSTVENGSVEYYPGHLITVTADTVLYAVWIEKTYPKVTFYYDNGSSDSTQRFVVYPATTIETLPDNPVKTGYTFENWYTEKNGEGALFTSNTVVSGDMEVYANWTIKSYTLSFNNNGADSGNVPNDIILKYNDTGLIPVNSKDLVKAGHTFIGWSLSGNGAVSYKEGDFFTIKDKDVTLYAVWELNTYRVKYHNTGADSGLAPANYILNHGDSYTVDNNSGSMVKAGYSFKGWSTTADGSLTYLGDQSITVNSDLDLYPVWGAEGYYLFYNDNSANGGDIPASVTGQIGSVIPVEGNTGALVKTGYKFEGWSSTKNGNVEYVSGDSITLGAGNFILYAVWSKNSYTLTYHNTGADSGLAPSEAVIEYKNSTTILDNSGNMAKTGYSFIGWSTSVNGYLNYSVGYNLVMEDENINLYPVWEINNYSVTYFDNGADSGNVPASLSYNYGTNVTVKDNSRLLLKNGHTFSGWSTTINGAVDYTGGESITIGTADIELYAVWEKNSYTITYFDTDAENGTAPSAVTLDYGSSYRIEDNTGSMSKTGYSFKGWATSPSGTLKYFISEPITVDSNLNLYPVWDAFGYYVKYNGANANGGDVPNPSLGNIGSVITVEGNSGSLVKKGNTFKGWSTVMYGSIEYRSGDTIVLGTEDITLYAVWERNIYKIIYHNNGADTGSAPSEGSVYYQGSTSLSWITGSMTKVGHSFVGWSTTSNGNVEYTSSLFMDKDYDINLYPVWEKNKYSVTYYNTGADSGNVPATVEYEYLSSAVIEGNSGSLIKAGHDFAGWSTSENGSVEYTAGNSISIGLADIKLYPVWNIKQYSITYYKDDANSGDAPTSSTLNYGVSYSIESNTGSLNKAGHTFKGWSTSAGGTLTYSINQSITVNADLDLYPVWDTIDYYVIYNDNNSTGGVVPGSSVGQIGSEITVTGNSGALEKTGHNFEGWSTTQNGSVQYLSGNTVTLGAGNITLYAVWSKKSYRLTYNTTGADSGSAPLDEVIEYTSSTTVSDNIRNLVKAGHSFTGWSATSNGSVDYAAGSNLVMGAGNIDLYPVWSKNRYSLTYNTTGADSGSAPSNVEIEYAGSTIVSGNSGNLVKAGHSFTGWSTTVNGSVDYASGSSLVMGVGNINLYPVWSKNTYNITFNDNGATSGSSPDVISDLYGENITLPDQGTLVRDNFTFKGWSTTNNGNVEYNSGDQLVISNNDVTLFAVWYKNQAISSTVSIPTGSNITLTNPLEVVKGNNINITVEENFATYKWYLDGTLIPGENQKTLSLNTSSLDAKQYELTVVVIDNNGVYSSLNCRVRVTN